MTPVEFRLLYPEFVDVNKYPTFMVQAQLSVGELRLDVNRWGELREHGLGLFVAHQLVNRRLIAESTAKGGAPSAAGVISSKSVGSVSVSYATGETAVDGAGNYNSTVYGREFWQLAQMVGIGGIQL